MLGQVDHHQMHNRNKLKKKIEDGTFGFLAPEPLREDQFSLFLALMPWLVKPYIRRQFTREELHDLQRWEGSG